jgi:hypothetical protein
MKYLYETDSAIVLKAEVYPDRFNYYSFRFIVSKKTGLMELGLRSENEPSKPWETTLVDEENEVLIIKTQFWTMRIQEIQILKVYETHFSVAGYPYSRCDGATLLNFPIYVVTPN